MRRYFIALCSACVAAGVAAADLILGLSSLDPKDRGVPGRPSWEEQRLFLDACIIFYGTAYATGRFIYRYLGRPDEAAMMRHTLGVYVAFLHLFGGVWLLIAAVTALVLDGVLRPALFIGALLAAVAVWEARDVVGPQLRADLPRIVGPRGESALAFVAALLPLFTCTGLMDLGPAVAWLAGGVTFVAGGLVCMWLGRKWRHEPPDQRAWLRLETWGWIYTSVGIVFCLLVGGGWLKKALVG